jgi:hypothetical protein
MLKAIKISFIFLALSAYSVMLSYLSFSRSNGSIWHSLSRLVSCWIGCDILWGDKSHQLLKFCPDKEGPRSIFEFIEFSLAHYWANLLQTKHMEQWSQVKHRFLPGTARVTRHSEKKWSHTLLLKDSADDGCLELYLWYYALEQVQLYLYSLHISSKMMLHDTYSCWSRKGGQCCINWNVAQGV